MRRSSRGKDAEQGRREGDCPHLERMILQPELTSASLKFLLNSAIKESNSNNNGNIPFFKFSLYASYMCQTIEKTSFFFFDTECWRYSLNPTRWQCCSFFISLAPFLWFYQTFQEVWCSQQQARRKRTNSGDLVMFFLTRQAALTVCKWSQHVAFIRWSQWIYKMCLQLKNNLEINVSYDTFQITLFRKCYCFLSLSCGDCCSGM